jgi:hypothetical protein
MSTSTHPEPDTTRLVVNADGQIFREETFAPRLTPVHMPIVDIMHGAPATPLVLPPQDNDTFVCIPDIMQYLQSGHGGGHTIAIRRLPALLLSARWKVLSKRITEKVEVEGEGDEDPEVVSKRVTRPYAIHPFWSGGAGTVDPGRPIAWFPPEGVDLLFAQGFASRTVNTELTSYMQTDLGNITRPANDKYELLDHFVKDWSPQHPLWASPMIPATTPALFFFDRDTRSVWTPPIPNVYESGKLCTGTLSTTFTLKQKMQEIASQGRRYLSLTDVMDVQIAAWQSNRWNADLISRHSRAMDFTSRFMLFDPDEYTPLPDPNPEEGTWKDLTCRCSNSTYNTALSLFAAHYYPKGN